jgi:thiamine-phosphate pyrophosphorylase
MLLPNMTPAAERAVAAAQQWARRQGSREVMPVHLLTALAEEEEGKASTLLNRAGLSRRVLWDYLASFPTVLSNANPSFPLPLNSLVHQALDHARTLVTTSDRTVASEHLLMALVSEDTSLRKALESLGLNSDQLETAIVSMKDNGTIPLDEPLCLAPTTEEIDTARILDAGLNRAKEALRVVEDYCRFSLDDAFLTGELKAIRHQLTEAFSGYPQNILLEGRETLRDVGTGLSTPQENERTSLAEVVSANFKRLQEALRSLEEFGKLRGPGIGPILEKLRYTAYTLERSVLLGAGARKRLADARLYLLVTGSQCESSLDWTIKEAAAGGVQLVQLREKNLDDKSLYERARQVRKWTREADVLFIVNDRPDIARLVEADGVHLGQDDLPVKEARRILGPDALIGVSTHSLDQVREAVLDGAGYIAVGPVFPSGTKQFAALPGLEFVRLAAAETTLPAFAVGGINADNAASVVAAGLRRGAVSQAICRANDPRCVAARLRQILDGV